MADEVETTNNKQGEVNQPNDDKLVFTPKEFDSEVDTRIANALATAKEKWDEEKQAEINQAEELAKLSAADRKKAEDEYYAVYGPDQKKQTDNIIIEAKGSGISLHQDLHRIGLPTFSYNPGREDKVQRFMLAPTLQMSCLSCWISWSKLNSVMQTEVQLSCSRLFLLVLI